MLVVKFSAKRYLLIGTGVLLGGWAAAASFVIANQTRAPHRSLAAGVAPQHYAEASMARALYKSRLVRNAKAMPARAELRLAERAFAGEPLAAAAFPILVQSLAAEGKIQQSEKLLTLTGELTRRDSLLNAFQIDAEVKRNRPEHLVKLFGRAMAVNYEVRSFYMDRMAGATANPAAIDGLVPMLGGRPRWERAYWDAVLNRPEILPQAAGLRRRLAGPPWNRRTPNDVDVDIVARLTSARNPQIAYDLARALGLRKPAGGNMLLNGGFNEKKQFVPFDWEVIQSGEVGASIDAKAGTMLVSGLASTDGVLFRQLVDVGSAGRYRLSWDMTGLLQSPGALMKFRLACAEAKGFGHSAAAIGLTDGKAWSNIDVDPSGCRWHWAQVELDTTQSDSGLDALIEQLDLRRAAGTTGDPRGVARP